MMVDSIKAVLFDYGGVLAEEGFRNGLMAMAREQDLDVDSMPKTAMQTVYDSGYVVGKGSVHEFWALLKKRTGLKGHDNILTQRILDGFVLRSWMMDTVNQLNDEGYVTGILSDQTDWLDKLDKRDHFFEPFDHVFNSYYYGKGKRDPSLFHDVADTLLLKPEQLLFVDDSEVNVANARSAGWQVIHYQDREQFHHSITPLFSVTEKA